MATRTTTQWSICFICASAVICAWTWGNTSNEGGNAVNAKLKNTALQLARQMECARAAGIYEHTFLSFGGLLGFVREQGFIEGDNDLDVGVFADNITAEQEREFVRLLGMPTTDFPTSKGLFEYRERSTRREDNGRY
jgi:hypothetical protein